MAIVELQNGFTPLHWFSNRNITARKDIPIPRNESHMKLITSEFNISNVKWMIVLIPTKNEFHIIWYHTLAVLTLITSFNTWNLTLLKTWQLSFPSNAGKLYDPGYSILKLKNIQLKFHKCTKMSMIGQIVLSGLFLMLNTIIRYLLHLWEKELDKNICRERILHLIESSIYDL